MSMLTPPGLKGKQYRITGTAYPRMRRPHPRRRYLLLAVTGVTVLTVFGWGLFQLTDVFGGRGRATAQAAACGPTAAPSTGPSAGASGAVPSAAATKAAAFAALTAVPPKPGTITVNVYNATDRAGLAGATAAQLKLRGFVIGKIGNAPAPLLHKVAGTADVVGNSAAAPLMTVLGAEVTGAVPVTDLRKDGTVDLVLGTGFGSLAAPAGVAQTLALAAKPVPTATPHC